MKPLISCFGPGIRTEYWMRLYNSIASNGIPFELVMVGNRNPDFELPNNFRHIYSEVKPSQCAEIGFRNTTGELVMPVADDEVFSEGAVQSAYILYRRLDNPQALVSYRFVLQGKDISNGFLPANRYHVWNPDSPLAPICPLMSRELWQRIGGIDKRFIALYWDLDLAMRIYEIGGIGILSPDAKVEELGRCILGGEHNLYDKYGPCHDRVILDSFWTIPGQYGLFSQIVSHRLTPIESFEDKDLLTITQGSKGEWI